MGAWGLGLFESDHDFDILCDLDRETSLDKLTDDARAKLELEEKLEAVKLADEEKKSNTKPSNRASKKASREANKKPPKKSIEQRVLYTIWPVLCTDIKLVRDHLESTGELDRLIDKWSARAKAPREEKDFEDPDFEMHDPGYKLVVIGAVAMMMGCTLKEEFLEYLRSIFLKVGLMRDALKQVDTALNGPHGFKNGEPYHWGPLGAHEKIKNRNADRIHPGSACVNVHNPGLSFHAQPDTSALEKKIRERMELIKKEKPDDVCGACGASEKDGEPLVVCHRCKLRKYCDRDCQKKHWETHKQLCAQPPGHYTNDNEIFTCEEATARGGVCMRTITNPDGSMAIVEMSRKR